MNTTPQGDADDRELPSLSEARVEQIENRLFHDIGRARAAQRARRGRGWLIGSAAAAVIVVAAVIAPSVGTLVGGGGTLESADQSAGSPASPLLDGATTEGGTISGISGSSSESLVKLDAGGTMAADGSAVRDIISTASATVVVDDVSSASKTIADAAQAGGGYVESMSVGRSGQVLPVAPLDGGMVTDTMPYPSAPDGAWITVRVPADQLSALVDQLSDVGEVTASTVNRQDVTEQTLDLQARVDAAQASVDRITALMVEAGTLTDVISAEAALAERQATLESYQQQLKYYDDQVAMSTLSVTLTPPASAVETNPAGFADGVVAGWNGLVATLNAIVIAVGFLIPWIVIVGVVAVLVWAIVRLVRRTRRSRGARGTRGEAPTDTP